MANLTASRVSSERMRKLRVFAPSLYCSVDMHARDASGRAASPTAGDGRPRSCPRTSPVEPGDPLDARARGLRRAPCASGADALVSGEVGRDALVLAERVLEAIEAHRADGAAGSRGVSGAAGSA